MRRDHTGRAVGYAERAETAARYLSKVQWTSALPHKRTSRRKISPREAKTHFNTASITVHELNRVIKKLKRNKTPGPDEVPMEFFK